MARSFKDRVRYQNRDRVKPDKNTDMRRQRRRNKQAVEQWLQLEVTTEQLTSN